MPHRDVQLLSDRYIVGATSRDNVLDGKECLA